MPTVSADKIINKGLIAKAVVPKLNASLTKIGEFKPGDAIGVVYSYIQRGNTLYWIIEPGANQPQFLVPHKSTNFVITDDIQNAIRQQRQQREREQREFEIQQKGAIPYYIEKYGKWLILVVAGTVILQTIIKKR